MADHRLEEDRLFLDMFSLFNLPAAVTISLKMALTCSGVRWVKWRLTSSSLLTDLASRSDCTEDRLS